MAAVDDGELRRGVSCLTVSSVRTKGVDLAEMLVPDLAWSRAKEFDAELRLRRR